MSYQIIARNEHKLKIKILPFNAAKCKCMHLRHDNPEITYTMRGAAIATATEQKDLGVYLTNDCKPSLQ